ncbi:MAG: hypothetical protein ABH870_06325 [bacterium]
MAFQADDLDKLKTEINTLMPKIAALSTATGDAKTAAITDLIGGIIGLVLVAIKAAMD